MLIKSIIVGAVIFVLYRMFMKEENSTVKKRKSTKIDYKKVKDAEFEDHE